MSTDGHSRRSGVRGVLLVLVCAMVVGLSCTGAPQTDVAPGVDWVPDGNVTPGEYTDSVNEGAYRLYWVCTEDTVRVAIEADTIGWVAVGFPPGHGMKDADIVLGMVSSAQTIVIDQYSTGNYGPHRGDSELGGTDDLLAYGAKESDGVTVVEFERALDTGDVYDAVLQKGVAVNFIWAYGSTDSEAMKHSKRGHGDFVP